MKDDVLDLMNYCYLELESDNLYDVRKRSKCIHVLDHSAIVKKKYLMNHHGDIIQVNGLSRFSIALQRETQD